jgi:hypothetical protein
MMFKKKAGESRLFFGFLARPAPKPGLFIFPSGEKRFC